MLGAGPETSMDPNFIKSQQAESWALYSVAVCIYGLRIFTKIYYNGLRQGIQTDDYVMTFAMVSYTTLVSCLRRIVLGGGSNLFPPEELETFTPENINDRIEGSKFVLVSEQAMLVTIWSTKACLLIFYERLTTGLNARRAVKAIAWYVLAGFIALELTFFLACRPFNGYWAVPPPDSECTTFVHYATVNAAFNISSDILMMMIPLPLLIKSKLAIKQKIAVCSVFLMGIFVIVAAILTKYFNLSDIYNVEYMKWYSREASVAVYVSNIPLIWPLIRRIVPGLKNATSSKGSKGKYNNASSGIGRCHFHTTDVEMTSGHQGHGHGHGHSHSSRLSKGHNTTSRAQDTVWETESQEAIFGLEDGVIRQDVTVTVESEKMQGWVEANDKGGVFVSEHNGPEYSITIHSKNPAVTVNNIL